MLHLMLEQIVKGALRQYPAIATAMNQDGAVSMRIQGGMFEAGQISLHVPKGLEAKAQQALEEGVNHATVALFVGVAGLGQPSHLSHTQARVRLTRPTDTAPGFAQAGFVLELGWQAAV